MATDLELTDALARLGDGLHFAAADELAPTVMHRLEGSAPAAAPRPGAGRLGGRRRWRGIAAAVAASSVIALLPGPRSAIAGWIGRGRVRVIPVEVVPTAPQTAPSRSSTSTTTTGTTTTGTTTPSTTASSTSPTGATTPVSTSIVAAVASSTTSGISTTASGSIDRTDVSALNFGEPVEPADWSALGDLPASAVLGDPVAVLVDRRVPDGAISLVWAVGGALPQTRVEGVGAVLTVVAGTVEDVLIGKFTGSAATIEPVDVAGHDGLFIGSEAHSVVWLDARGETRVEELRLAGTVVVWVVDGVTYRFESMLVRGEAVELAASFIS